MYIEDYKSNKAKTKIMVYNMDRNIARRFDQEIRDLKEQQQRCLSRIDDLEDQHQSNPSTHLNPQGDNWDQMRNKVNNETRKEIDFLKAKQQEDASIETEFEALKRAKESGTLPADEWREKLKDLARQGKYLDHEMRRRKRLVLEISENVRMDVTCTREDWRPLDEIFLALDTSSIQAELRRTELEKSRGLILDKQAECLDFLYFEKDNELNKSENNYNINKRHIESKFNSQIRFVKEQASSELKMLDSHGLKMRILEKRTDIFKKRIDKLYANGKALLSPSYESALQKEAESLKKEWDTLLAFKVPDVFDLRFEKTRGVLKVTCTSSNGTAVCPGNTKKGKGKRQKITTNGVVSV